MVRTTFLRTALLLLAAATGSSFLCHTAPAQPPTASFDKPIRKIIVDLGPSPSQRDLPQMHYRVTATCFYYPTFMVKQLEEGGMKGTGGVLITSVAKNVTPPCQRSHTASDRFLDRESRFFIGAKGNFLFLEEADGLNGGMGFQVIDRKTGKKLFEDIAWQSSNVYLRFVHSSDGTLMLKYLRSLQAECSIPKDGTACWNKLRRRHGLPQMKPPKCLGYDGEFPVPAKEVPTPSAIAYPVLVSLSPKPHIQALLGTVKCFPSE